MYNLILGIRGLCTLIIVFMFLWLMHEKHRTKEHSALLITMVFIYMFDLNRLIVMTCTNQESALLLEQLKNLSIFGVMAMMFYFCVCYTKIKLPRTLYLVLGVFTLFTNIFILLPGDPKYGFYKTIGFEESGVYPHLKFTFGFTGYFFEGMILCLALLVAGIAITYYRKTSQSKREVIRKKSLLAATIMPTILLITYDFRPQIEYTVLVAGLMLSAGVFIYASYRFRIFDVVETTKNEVLKTMDTGFIILNNEKQVLYMNDMAKQLTPALLPVIENIRPEKNSIISYTEKEREYEIHEHIILENDEVGGYYLYILDVTEKKNQLYQLEQAKEAAEMASSFKSSFVANVSHDLRTPLNGIIGMAEIALRGEIGRELKFQLKSILSSGRNMLTIVNDLLDLSKIEAGRIELTQEAYQLENVIYEVMNIAYMSLGEKNIYLKAVIAEGVPEILYGDAVRIQQILQNLMGNAVKYTEEGSIELEVTGQGASEDYQLCFCVRDTGIGILPEEKDKIFLKYQQASNQENKTYIGTGLGLNIVKDLVELMQGSIQVESEVAKGTAFHITIHQKYEETQKKSEEKEINSQMLREGYGEEYLDRRIQFIFPQVSVLVVDDISTNLLVAKGLLEPYHVSIDCVNSADAAIRAIKEKKYHIILMDLLMPIKDGTEAVAEIRQFEEENGEHAVIVAVTADVTSGDKQYFLEKGFSDYISKPIKPQKLEELLLKWLPKYKRMTIVNQQDNVAEKLMILSNCGIRVEEGMMHNGNNLKNYLRVLSAYKQEVSSIIPELVEYENLDEKLLETKVHGLKSSSYAIGAKETGRMAEKIEANIKEKKTEHLSGEIQYFIKLLNEVCLGIEKFQLQYQQNQDVEAPKEKSLLEDGNWWEQLEKALAGYDAIRAERIIKEAEKSAREEELAFLRQAADLINGYDYGKCRELLLEEKKKYSL